MTTPRVLLVAVLVFLALPASAQLYAPEGANMPGSWSTNAGGGWLDPPSLLKFAGIIQPGGLFLLDTSLVQNGTPLTQRRYTTSVHVAASGGDLTGGTYRYRFTSPSFGTPGGNRWARSGAVIMDSAQAYTYNANDTASVDLVNGSWYLVSYKDAGYVNTEAMWLRTSAEPREMITVSQTPGTGAVNPAVPVQVNVTLNGTPSPEEQFYLRYSTNNYTSSTFLPLSVTGSTGTATIPGFGTGTGVKYYVFSTTAPNITVNTDLKTLRVNNNNRASYTYTVLGDTLTIAASAGPNGTITPSGNVKIFRGRDTTFTFTPSVGYIVDSVIVDGILLPTAPVSYTFDSVVVNRSIRVTFAQPVDVTFQVNLAKKMREGAFRPDLGDRVTLRGTFNDWGNSTNNPDTLLDGNADSIYTITKVFTEGRSYLYKFWKTERSGQGYETNIADRPLDLGAADTTLPVVFFNNEGFPVGVTFSVNMRTQMIERNFRPDAGDIVTVRGTFNDWGNSTNNPDTLTDGDNDSVYTKVVQVSPGTADYKFWKSERGFFGYEPRANNENRSVVIGAPAVLPTVYFNDDSVTSVSVGVFNDGGGWNMVSLPVIPANDSVTAVFTTALQPFAFAYSPGAGYVQRRTLEPGAGYWLKFGADQSLDIPGGIRVKDTVAVVAGWNMVGGLSVDVDTSAIGQVPAGLITTPYYGFNPGYVADSLLRPGKAYWVKASTAGSVIMDVPPAPALAAAPARRNPLAGMNRLTITDASGAVQTLWFGTEQADLDLAARFAMPPLPPEGAFDARFASDRMVETAGEGAARFPVSVRSNGGPITVAWEIVNGGGRTIELRTADGRTRAMKGAGAVTLSSAAGLAVEMTGADLPVSYELAQNYPNPFNPVTNIRYALPVDARVTVAVFDVLGRKVATLVDDLQAAGSRVVEWNGRNGAGLQAASGMYFYRIDASPVAGGESFTSVRKMMLLK